MMADFFERSDEPLALLTDAFSALRKLGNSVAVGYRDSQGDLPIGIRKMFKDRDDQISHHFHEQDAMPKLRVMLDAVAASGLNARKLKLCINIFAKSEDEITDRLVQNAAVQTVLVKLADIEIEFYAIHRSIFEIQPPTMMPAMLGRLFSVPTGLRKLSLRARSDISYLRRIQFQSEIGQLIRPGTLKHVSLTQLNIDEAVLIHFLGSHKTTLNSLVLESLVLNGIWAFALSFIANDLTLDRVVFGDAFEISHANDHPLEWHEGLLDLRGRDEISLELEKLMLNRL